MRNSNTSRNTLKLFIINIGIIALVFSGFFFMRGNHQIVDVGTIALNVHTEPSPFSPVLTQVHQEDRVTIQEKKENWYKIVTSDKTEGWVADWLVFEGTSGPYTSLPAMMKRKNIPLKKENNDKSKTIRTLKKKEKITVTLELDNWVRIQTEDGIGWVPAKDVAIRKTQLKKPADNQSLSTAVNMANLLKENKTTAQKIQPIHYGEKLTFLSETDNGWYKVKSKDGTEGYVQPWQISTSKINTKDKRPNTPLSEFIVMLDPGHGGEDPGAQTNDGKHFEKELTLKTALAVKKELERQGAKVLMTRHKDEFLTLSKIGRLSSQSDANAFVSFHYDSSENFNEGSGTTTFYRQDNSYSLAEHVNEQISSILPLDNRGFDKEDYQVLRENNKPAILLELGYINNDVDASYAQSKKYHQKVAISVYQGLYNYFEEEIKKEADN